MATVLMVPLMLYLLAVLAGRHVHCKSTGAAADGLYDVTEYGAAPSRKDNKDAFLAAWRAACSSTAGNATLLIPEGTFAVGAVEFSGPCKSGGAPVVVIDGVLRPCTGGCHLTDDDWITFSALSNLLVTGAGTLDGQGGARTNNAKTTTLELDGVTNSTVRGLRFVDSRGFHLSFHRSSRVAAEGLRIHAPASSRNTDGIHVGCSSHVRIADSVIGTGDDCVSVGPGSSDVVVTGIICGPGHGISVGSLGRKEGEEDSNITFEDIIMADVSNPILIDQRYCPHGRCSDVDKPSRVQISDVTFRRIQGTSSSKVAVQLRCSEEQPCSGVRLDGINLRCGDQPCHAQFANVRGAPALEAQAPSLWVQEAHGLPSDAE
uniref:Exopolygalacturonase n=1 Tax=Triticum urartu TaxID=4572 RepID=A0A8R7V5P6_TRIUA